jgi:hypothetical protein
VIVRRLALFILLVPLSTCDESTDGAACEPSDAPASLSVDNRTGGLVSTITATPCDGDEQHVLPLSEAGLAFQETATLALPGPGCWLLTWSGEDCTNDPPYRTSTDVCAGETYAWTITVEGRVCDPGGW